jgi:N-acetylglucosaminyldiphosphoundecaprenol N-acetyl-beta-D-mannosaminyltransferase
MVEAGSTANLWPTYPVAGMAIAAVTPDQAADLIVGRRVREVHLCTTHTLSEVQRDPRLGSSLAAADLNLPDGAPVAWLGRPAGVRSVVYGPSLTVSVMEKGVSTGLRHYLYGGAPGVAEQMCAVLEARVPGVKVAGTECPPYRELDQAELAELGARIDRSGADIVWIGLGTPKQDYLVHELAPHTAATLVPVGSAFDFISGNVAQAPEWMHGTGLEWAYRLAREPRRLWRRYLIGGPRFVTAVLRNRRSVGSMA